MSDDSLAFLDSIHIFENLAIGDRRKLASLFIAKSFNAGETIFMKGDEGHGMYLIQSGKVKICAFDQGGNELIFAYLNAGDLLGEIAVLDGLPRSADVVALTQTRTLYLGRADVLAFLKTSPQTCIEIIYDLCRRLRGANAHLEELSFLDVSGRTARNLLSLSVKDGTALYCSITQEELAGIVGASREMVNKVLNSFVDRAYVSIARKRITILAPAALDKIGNYDLVA